MDLDVVKSYIANSSESSAIYIGCDSSVFKDRKTGKKYARYVSVVVIHYSQKHGCKLFYDSKVEPFYGSLRQRLLMECHMAIEVASEIADYIGPRKLEVHLDLNADPKHASNIAVSEAIGYVKAMGLVPRIKPEAFAATCAADHRT